MQCDSSDMSLQEWPTLNDVVNRRNLADGRFVQNVQSTSNENGMDNAAGYASSTENDGPTANNSTKAVKKNSSKRNNWTRLPINPPPYRQRGNGRRNNDSTRPFENGQNSHNGSNYSNGFVNGRGNFRNRGTRGNRGRGYSNYRPRREMPAVNSESAATPVEVTGHCINGVVFYSSSSQYRNISAENLKEKIKRQIEYYLSEENLNNDVFIRRKMDIQGYVPLSLIATFNRMRKLTDDMEAIVEAVKESSKLELHDDFLVRPVVDPLRWPAPFFNKITAPLRTDVPEFYPGQPYISVDPVIEQIGNLHLNHTVYHPSLRTPINLQYPPNSIEDVNNFSVLGATASVLQQDSNGLNHYIDDPAVIGVGASSSEQVTNGLNHFMDDPSVLGVGASSSEQASNGLDHHYMDGPSVLGVGASSSEQTSNGLTHRYMDGPSVMGVGASSLQQASNGLNHYIDDPVYLEVGANSLGQDSSVPNHYVDDQTVTNGFNYYSNDSSPVQQISGCDYFPQPVNNGVMFYKNNQQSSEGGCYSVLNTAEKLPNGVDSLDDQTFHNKSPEPPR